MINIAELIGGPLDGAVLNTAGALPPFLVLAANGEGLLYKPKCCFQCASRKGRMSYVFTGYSYDHEDDELESAYNSSAREYQA